MKKKALLKFLLTLFLVFVALFFLRSGLYNTSSNRTLDQKQKEAVLQAASTSLETLDVPVGALVLYHDTVLSSGYNTVRRDSNVAGHAEINALNNAIRKIGFKAFSNLDRENLVLVSTYEPCMMCKGAISEYNIRNILFMKGKGIWHWLKNDAKELRYEFYKKQCDGDAEQDSLFMMHPEYSAKGNE